MYVGNPDITTELLNKQTVSAQVAAPARHMTSWYSLIKTNVLDTRLDHTALPQVFRLPYISISPCVVYSGVYTLI